MRTEGWWARINRAEENQEWLLVKTNHANCRRWDGQYAESEHLQRKVLRGKEPNEEHPSTLTTKANLAPSLRLRGKNAEAEPRRSGSSTRCSV